MKKNLASIIISLVAVFFLVTACIVEIDPSENLTRAGVYGDGTFSGEVRGLGRGGYGGNIMVFLDIVDGIIDNVRVTHFETANYGGVFITRMIPLIIRANSFEIDAITSSSLTQTRDAFLEAGRNAIAEIPGVDTGGDVCTCD